MQSEAATTKLPVLATVRHAWGSVLKNAGLLGRLSWPWLAILVLSALAGGVGVAVNSLGQTPTPGLILGAFAAPYVVMAVAGVLGVSAISVGWHRGVLTGERPGAPIRLDRTVWAYLGYTLLIGLVVGIVNLILVVVVGWIGAIASGANPVMPSMAQLEALAPFFRLALIPGLLLSARFFLVLPARAVEQKVGLGGAFRLGRGNTWRLVIGAGLVTLPATVLQGVTELLALPATGDTSIAVLAGILAIAASAASIYCALAAMSFLAFSYDHLGRSEAELAAA